jgi:signal transduction histidine kinase
MGVKIIFIAVLVASITFFHYITELELNSYHIFYQGLYFLPVMLAGFWFGLRGALGTSLSITILYLPFTFIYWKGFSVGDINNVMELVLYNAIAVILGKLKDREKAVQKRLSEAERLAAMGKAFSGLAHDLKTPLIAIGGLSRLIQKNLEEKNPFREKLDIIIEETQRLEKMVKEMLDFSRPLELHQSQEDVNQIICQTLVLVDDIAQKRRVRFHLQSSPNLPLISFDPTRMKQVLINLLINALEASSEGEVVTIHSYQEKRKLIIDVRDYGCGISIDKKVDIFSPFFTTKKEGIGLGLTIAKKIVEAHQGSLDVSNNPEKGLTFQVKIPIV